MARKRKAPKEKKPKKINILLVPREHAGKVTEVYKTVDKLVAKYHRHLNEADARIAVAWDKGPAKDDADGYVRFGRVKRNGDLDREFAPFDFVLIVRKELFDSFDATRREAELDRLLCRCAVVKDKNYEVVVDEKGRSQFRLRRPVEVFPENVARYGFHQEPKLGDMLAKYNDSKRPLLKDQGKQPAQRFSEPANKPKGKGKPETNGHAGNGEAAAPAERSWRDEPINALPECPASVLEALAKNDLLTLGDVFDYADEHGNVGVDSLRGMGTERGESLRAAIGRYREANPEKFEAVEA